MKKIALIAALVLGTASAALAEDSSSSFAINTYGQAAQQHVLTTSPVAMKRQVQVKSDRASSSYGGSSF